jgi:arsenite methyltransferase
MQDYLQQKIDFYDPNVVSIYDETPLWSARFGMLLLDHLPIKPFDAILDIGCGTGFPCLELAQIYGNSCQVTGIDLWDEALERARLKQHIYQLQNVHIMHANASSLPLPDKSFDLITSNLGINNFDQPELVFAECARIAKPNAYLMLTTNLTGHMQEFYDMYRDVLQKLDKTLELEKLDLHEAHRGTKESVCTLVNNAGFVIDKIIEDQFYFRFLDGSTFFRHYFIKIGFLEGWRSIVAPSDEKEIFTLLEERLNQKAHEQGELKLTIPMLLVKAQRSD